MQNCTLNYQTVGYRWKSKLFKLEISVIAKFGNEPDFHWILKQGQSFAHLKISLSQQKIWQGKPLSCKNLALTLWGAICVKIETNFTVIKNLGFIK